MLSRFWRQIVGGLCDPASPSGHKGEVEHMSRPTTCSATLSNVCLRSAQFVGAGFWYIIHRWTNIYKSVSFQQFFCGANLRANGQTRTIIHWKLPTADEDLKEKTLESPMFESQQMLDEIV